jgi:hypothetical protein
MQNSFNNNNTKQQAGAVKTESPFQTLTPSPEAPKASRGDSAERRAAGGRMPISARCIMCFKDFIPSSSLQEKKEFRNSIVLQTHTHPTPTPTPHTYTHTNTNPPVVASSMQSISCHCFDHRGQRHASSCSCRAEHHLIASSAGAAGRRCILSNFVQFVKGHAPARDQPAPSACSQTAIRRLSQLPAKPPVVLLV